MAILSAGSGTTRADRIDALLLTCGGHRAILGPLLLIVLVLSLQASALGRSAHVNGQSVPVGLGRSVSSCASVLGITTARGPLLSIRGTVLSPSGGLPVFASRNGYPLPLDGTICAGDNAAILPGHALTEPARDHVIRLSAHPVLEQGGLAPHWGGRLPIHGILRTSTGKVSGMSDDLVFTSATPVVEWKEPGGPPLVALTFDDGPHGSYTPRILDVLKRYNAHATFFVLGGMASRRPDLVKRAVADGHEIAIHSWSHPQYTHLSQARITADLARCAALIKPLNGGAPIRWVRPPYGAVNSSVRRTIEAAGFGVVLWSVDTSDWRRPGASAIAQRVLSRAHNGSVVLMHDGGGNRDGTVAAVARLIPELQRRGFMLVTLSELRGRQPVFAGEVIVRTAEGELRVRPVPEPLHITVNSEAIQLPAAPLDSPDGFLLPPQPILSKLGASYAYDKEQEIVNITTERGSFVLRLDCRKAQLNDSDIWLQLPPILYRDQPMLPARFIANACRANLSYDPKTRTLQFDSQRGATILAPPPAPPGHGGAETVAAQPQSQLL